MRPDNENNSQYFEGVLQLRNPNEKALEFINGVVGARKGVFFSKIVEEKNGFDFYISSQRFLRSLGKMVHEKFGGELKTSSSLHTRDSQTSKDLYRINIFIRLPNFVKGDIIKVDDKVFKVQGFLKSLVSCKNVRTGKRTHIKFKGDLEVLKKIKTTVSKIHPQLEVLHPITYDSVPVDSSESFKLGENVKVVIADDLVILVE